MNGKHYQMHQFSLFIVNVYIDRMSKIWHCLLAENKKPIIDGVDALLDHL